MPLDTLSYKTRSAKATEFEPAWFVIDASQAVVGRLATQIATLLRGKHKPYFTPHVDTGDYVIVVNADKVRFTGNKEEDKLYYRYSGYPGGLKTRRARDMRERRPEHIVRHAVKGMLPKGRLGRAMLSKLKVYAGAEHPHVAQQPEPFALTY